VTHRELGIFLDALERYGVRIRIEFTDGSMVAAKHKVIGGQGEFDEGSSGRLGVERLFTSNDEARRVWWLRGKIHDRRR
jgi:hypothetical protein